MRVRRRRRRRRIGATGARVDRRHGRRPGSAPRRPLPDFEATGAARRARDDDAIALDRQAHARRRRGLQPGLLRVRLCGAAVADADYESVHRRGHAQLLAPAGSSPRPAVGCLRCCPRPSSTHPSSRPRAATAARRDGSEHPRRVLHVAHHSRGDRAQAGLELLLCGRKQLVQPRQQQHGALVLVARLLLLAQLLNRLALPARVGTQARSGQRWGQKGTRGSAAATHTGARPPSAECTRDGARRAALTQGNIAHGARGDACAAAPAHSLCASASERSASNRACSVSR